MIGIIEHAQQTLKIWEEQKLWREAEAAGCDLTLLAQEWSWSHQQGIACQKLANSDIVEICDDNTISIIKRQISRLSRQINVFKDEVRYLKSGSVDMVEEIMAIEVCKWRFKASELIMRRHALRSVLSAALLNLSKKEVGFESITETDVEKARSISIESLYAWEKSKRMGHRFSACCPFHQESSPSFFIFKDNKFRCFSCSSHGDSIDFFSLINNVDFIDAVKFLIKK